MLKQKKISPHSPSIPPFHLAQILYASRDTVDEIIVALSPVISYRHQDIISFNVSISQTTTELEQSRAKTWLKAYMFNLNIALKLK